jgi:sugar lactone lactonase YvrE
MIEYFCYEPEDMSFWEQQLTHSVTFDHERGLLYAQPITFEEGGFENPIALSSSVGAYSLEGGQPVSWFPMPEQDFLAHGAAVDDDGSLLLGHGNEIYRFDPTATSEPQLLGVVSRVDRIEGLAVDAENNTLLVVDGGRDELIEVPLDL